MHSCLRAHAPGSQGERMGEHFIVGNAFTHAAIDQHTADGYAVATKKLGR